MSEAERKAMEAMAAQAQDRQRLAASLAPKRHERITMQINSSLDSIVRLSLEEAIAEFQGAFNDAGMMMAGGYDSIVMTYECAKRGMWALKTLIETHSTGANITPCRPDIPEDILAFFDSVNGVYAGVPIQLTHQSIGKWVWNPGGYSGRIMGTGSTGQANMILVGWKTGQDFPVQWELPDDFWQTFDEEPS